MRKWFWRWIILPILLIAMSFYGLMAGLLWVWKSSPVDNSMFMLAHRINGGTVTQIWVDYENIAKSAKQAAIASEDATFVNHNGFDIKGIEMALKKNQDGKIKMGGSTISQQLTKNLFLTSHRSYLRKGVEAFGVMIMENMWEKERILEVYLNVAEFGNGIYGIESAAQHYFKVSASQLTNEQSALLISMLPNPKFYENNLNNAHLKRKQKVIIKRMKGAVIP